jgi:ferrous iron transport protein A
MINDRMVNYQYHDRGMCERPFRADICVPSMQPTATVPLHQLPDEQWGVVADVPVPQDAQEQSVVLRLLELGFVPGERVRVVARAEPGRDPLAVRVGNTTFALRRTEARLVLVTPLLP